MSRQIQIRRGTAAEHENFTGAIGEITMDTTNKTIRVHDGTTAGGVPLAKQSEISEIANADYVVESQLPTAENNYTWYRKYKSGWVEQGGVVSASNGNGNVVLPITMIDTNYCITATNNATTSQNAWGWVYLKKDSKTTEGFGLNSRYGDGTAVYLKATWCVCGISA